VASQAHAGLRSMSDRRAEGAPAAAPDLGEVLEVSDHAP
jgi:hypothetical protein